jgi:hypothetical protein
LHSGFEKKAIQQFCFEEMAAAVPALDAAGVQEDLSKDLVGNGTRTFPVDQGGIAKVPSKSMIWQAAAAFTTALEKALTLLDGSKAKGQTSPYLLDNYAPILEETFAQDLEVLEGALPLDLSGTFLRTGERCTLFSPCFSVRLQTYFGGVGAIYMRVCACFRGSNSLPTFRNHRCRT